MHTKLTGWPLAGKAREQMRAAADLDIAQCHIIGIQVSDMIQHEHVGYVL